MTETPSRKHVLAMKIGADTFEGLMHALEQIIIELDENGNNSVTGGASWGGYYVHVVDPDQTREGYFADIEKYLEAKRREREGKS